MATWLSSSIIFLNKVRTMSQVKFDVYPSEAKIITAIIARAASLKFVSTGEELKSLEMDITACHRNGCQLRLPDLLQADDLNFAHDVIGIRNCIDRTTGKLTNNFLPRYANVECPERGQFFTKAEREGLLKVLQELKKLGWQVAYLDDGEERKNYPAGTPLEDVVYDANQTEDARIGLAYNHAGRPATSASIYVVWGNSPIELIADWCGSSSFDETIEAAQKAVWPNYPEE